MSDNPTQKEIDNLKKLLEAQKQEFLSVMSHELRTPMTGVKGYLSMILEGDVGSVSPEVKEFIAQAYVANDRLIRLVEHMMRVAKIQEGKIELHINKVDLDRETEMIVSDFQIPAKDKSQTLTYEKPKEELFVKGDPDRVREILMSLVSNAVKFTPEKGKIEVSHRFEGDWIITDIKDSGIGIPHEHQGRLFDILSKGNLTLTGQEK
ncbi:MAG: two-component sensor histidine kinase, partial [Candidatus Berkelbacteria bacterium]|nr:two-component sensor histidine kinase [Candidatus Berkelbacteria bacterium]